jgi:DNA repair photolyase
MGLNEQKGNMYGFVTHTWNTVKGKCPHDCSYCYMKRFPQREIRFDESELRTNLGTGNFIFVGSSNDMFADVIPHDWIYNTLEHMASFDNKYLLQSKNPERFIEFMGYIPMSSNVLCTTIETNRNYADIGHAPEVQDRAYAMEELVILGYETMITIEPVMDFDVIDFFRMLSKTGVERVNIGADSGRNDLPEPSKEKVLELIRRLEADGVEVHRKPNLIRILNEFTWCSEREDASERYGDR